MSIASFFVDPVLRAPTLGSMLMCLSSALVGVFVFLRKRSLVGETLSHAAYPGVVVTVFVSQLLFPYSEEFLSFSILIGAFITSFLGLQSVIFLEKQMKVKNDSALSFILALFFGVGILIASRMQTTHALWYKQAQLFLYGQAATMMDFHVLIYGVLSFFILFFILFFYRHVQAVNFDRDFAQTIGIECKKIDQLSFFLLVLAIVIGIRSVGVVLMAGMLIAPAAAARPFTKRLSYHFFIAGFFGIVSAFLGNVLSLKIPAGKYSLPTGPMILLCASTLAILSMCFAPQNGLISRVLRAFIFRTKCQMENGLKMLWKGERKGYLDSRWVIWQLLWKGWIKTSSQGYLLTEKGEIRAQKIVRLHRLWEVYLVDYMGQKVEKVHRHAEELEHLFTPELERELTELLKDPKQDPHAQPIPPSAI